MSKVIIIAEAGVNHNGSLDMAKEMVLAAKDAGADYIKFQTGVPEKVISKYAEMADYQKTNVGTQESQLDMVRKIMLPLSDFKPLKEYCDEQDVPFMSTPFDLTSIDVLAALDMDYIKIPSGEITNLPYLRKIAALGKPVIMSTGMSNMDEVEAALGVLHSGLTQDMITLLHCHTDYPTQMKDVNLRAMLALKERFGTRVGYSDHTLGIEIPIAAVAMGAQVIEKHFTLSRALPGPDHVASLEPEELKEMVRCIRNVEQALGSGEKDATAAEQRIKGIARKSIVAACNIGKGETLTANNLTVKRPGTGISPMRWDEVLGTKAIRNFKEDELIEL